MNAGPLRIGPLELDPPVVLAPMAGVTTRAFRRLCRRFGPGGLYVSEMLTSRAVVEGNERTARMLRFDDDERPRSAQLYGVAPGTVGEATRRLIGDFGVEHVDLNFGCPAPKVTAKGGGAALPVRRRLLADVIAAAVKAATPEGVPVTVKFRRGIHDGLLTAISTGQIAEAEGAAAVALHARTAEQRYAGDATWAAIAELKAAVTTIPVLGNGDIWEASDAVGMMDETGCDGVVIGRGCLGRPWLFADLGAVFAGRAAAPPPAFGVVAEVMLRHAELLAVDEGEKVGLCTFRRHAAWYTQGYAIGADARRALGCVSSLTELAALLAAIDPDLALPPEAVRWKRGHTDGPRPVRLPDGWLRLIDDPTPPAGAEILISGG
ncbi:MAG TPA: tRNA dihydrouridine synthase DusB [Acidimicrobiia bacterium]|nr:tRNA dihydrouridine synthase DusB [Acidimicrobiia bacterium]